MVYFVVSFTLFRAKLSLEHYVLFIGFLLIGSDYCFLLNINVAQVPLLYPSLGLAEYTDC